MVYRQPAVAHTVKRWPDNTDEVVRDGFNTTMSDVFKDCHGEDIDTLTEYITDCINFCVETTVPTIVHYTFSSAMNPGFILT